LARGDLTDAQWERLEKELPKKQGPGRPWADHRRVINGILWILRTGAPWRDLPARYGPYTTCHDRLLRWQRDGTWERILQVLQAEADAQGQVAWGECALDGSSVKAHPHAAGARKAPAKRGGTQRPLNRLPRRRTRHWAAVAGG
jgi:transposase